MKGIRYLSWFLTFVLFFLIGKAYGEKLVDTLDELEKIYPPSSVCAGCHANIFEQWKVSLHQESILHSIGGLRNFIKFGIEGEPERKARAEKPGGLKAELMKCFTCHAPQLELASDKLIKEIADAIVAFADKKDPQAKAKLERLNVSCYVCHNLKALHPPERPEKNVIYGVKGTGTSPFHVVKKHGFLQNSNFCMQCHGVFVAPDGEPIMCNTLSQSYRDHYVAMGGQKTCQDCHMKAKNRGHTFPGAYNLDTLREGIGINVDVRQLVDLNPTLPKEQQWRPAAKVVVDLINNAGHRIPDG
ncbi:MAG: multiheme c-type cytochrome ExtKL [Caldimicrobium sp.]|nr:multiheme c-type cytochrome ExtKL [Caldimicrobium sp.]MDW8094688.1 multiheme c-type cytochrome ExtKL [Caldimicrobium sp.]